MPVLLGLWFLDNALSKDRYIGWERNSVRNSAHRWAARKKAKVVILGSSTSKDWIKPSWLAKQVGKRPGDVLDAHINGCHQGCTYAEVRRLLDRGRHFEVAFFGTNLFQLCEFAHSKRVLQQTLMLPSHDIPRLFGIYTHAEQPLQYMARFAGIKLSGAYGDTAALQRGFKEGLWGKGRRGHEHRWYRKRRPRKDKPPLSCAYSDDEVAYKWALSEALFDDLAELAERSYLLFLPDRTASLDDPDHQERWRRHRALHEAAAAARPHLEFVDLVTDGPTDPKYFRDGYHLSSKGMKLQRALFEKRMKALPSRPQSPAGLKK